MNKKRKSNLPLRILLVEDDMVLQHVHRTMLEELGSKIDIADSGETALSKISNEHDLVFMDIGLPGIDGIETIRRIRALGFKKKDLPIVVLTAMNLKEIMGECDRAGATVLATKPISIEGLGKILKDFCQ